ncbi:AP-3 complex subunit mu, partial [Geosmithia morbida]
SYPNRRSAANFVIGGQLDSHGEPLWWDVEAPARLRPYPRALHPPRDTMNGVIEALHIYDDARWVLSLPYHSSPILSHTYTGRPLEAAHLLPLYLEHPAPQPSLIHLPNTNPPTLIFSLTHANLLLLATSSAEIEPLLVLEFLHRVVDTLEDFLGPPLLAVKIENSYDVVAQLLTEMCDAGIVSTTEPNALHEVVAVEGWVGKLLGSINLPGKTPSNPNLAALANPSLSASSAPAVPWRRSNVRHTSNEMYADVVETLSVTLAPSGRPLAAFANGTIAFNSKVSGVPDITVSLTSSAGKHNVGSVMELPVFHPCVRLNRWRERPGELSFIPPDGRFILAGYEVDLLPFTGSKSANNSANNLKLPVNLEIKTGLGTSGSEFEVRLQANRVRGSTGGAPPSGQLGRGGYHPGTPSAPLLEDLTLTIPLPADVRNLSDIRPSKGDASFNPGDKVLEWHVPASAMSGPTSYFSLRCSVVGPPTADDVDGSGADMDTNGFGLGTDYSYNEPYQSGGGSDAATAAAKKGGDMGGDGNDEKDARKMEQNKILMPSSASVSFSIKGWLASGLKVESILIDTRKSRGLGEGVKPYKGVKYLTVSQGVQRVGMLTPWIDAFPSIANETIDEIDSVVGYKLSAVIQRGTSRELTRTTRSQPAIMATSILILRVLERGFGFRVPDHFDFTLGHSLGEFASLVSGGYMSFQDSLRLVQRRAEAMSDATRRAVDSYGGEYGMVAIVTEPEYLQPLIRAIEEFVGRSRTGAGGAEGGELAPIQQVLIANVNSKNQIVLSGCIERIRTLVTHVRQFLGHDPRAVRLHSDSPFHSPIMRPAVSVVRRLLDGPSVTDPAAGIVAFPGLVPCVSNVTARPFRSAEELKNLVSRSCLETVRWWDSIRYLDQEEKVRRWVGIGPGKVGRNLVGKEVGMRGKDLVKGGGVWAITAPAEIEETKLQPLLSPTLKPSIRHAATTMTTSIPSIACLGVIGRNNNPLHMSTFPSYDASTNSFAPIRTPLEFSLLLSSTIDIFDLRSRHNAAAGVGLSGDMGLLHAVDDRLAAYGFETNTGVRLVCVVDMRGRRAATAATLASPGLGSGGGGAGNGGVGSGATARPGLRDAELKPVFRAMQAAYIRLLQNPFYDPDLHAPLGGGAGKTITSKKFTEDVRRIGEGWTPGVTSL